jgi:chorismate mutase
MKEHDSLLTLIDQKLLDNISFRLRVVQVVGVIKFFLKLPIENLDVEKTLLARIEEQSHGLKLNPMRTQILFEKIIAHSKQLQYEIFDILQTYSATNDVLILNELIELLRQDKPKYLMQWTLLLDSKVQLIDKLKICRKLIQQITDHSLQLMGKSMNLMISDPLDDFSAMPSQV